MLNRLQIAGGEGEQMEEPRVPTDLAQQLASIEEGVSPGVNLPPNLARIVLIVVVAGALLLIFYLVWRRRGRRRRKALDIEERDSIMSREMFLDQSVWLGSLLRAATPFHQARMRATRVRPCGCSTAGCCRPLASWAGPAPAAKPRTALHVRFHHWCPKNRTMCSR